MLSGDMKRRGSGFSIKRLFAAVGILILLLLVTAAVLVGSAFIGRQALTDGAEFNGIRIVKDGIVGIAVIPVGEKEVALIDAGNDPSGKAILAELSRRNLGPDAVTAILLTHGHPDHTAAIHLFSKAQVMALQAEVPLVEGKARAGGPFTLLMPVKPTGLIVTRALSDGDTVMLGQAAVHVYAVPGHTQGSAAYLVDGVLCLGDAADMYNNGEMEISAWIFTDDQAQDRVSLLRLDRRLGEEGADVKAIEFAHEGLVAKGLGPLDDFRRRNQ
jgi:glyoxylase-like metal-dependent hydrolase (beta-lactamase superfamily II)